MGYGIRVVLVMNRKGGSGKSTLCRALASAAAARGEAVTIFDTDTSKSCLKWLQAGKEAGNWSPLVEVIHTLDAHRVAEAIGQIYEQQDQEHLILIDTFGGGSEAQDVLAVAAHARELITHWVTDYNTARPHSAIVYQTRPPTGFALHLTTAIARPAERDESSARRAIAQPAPKGVNQPAAPVAAG